MLENLREAYTFVLLHLKLLLNTSTAFASEMSDCHDMITVVYN